ncbi:hypothetical protein ACFLTX_00010 [Chloroflexota bacterium]
MSSNTVPNSLKVWFFIHFLVDIAFAIPLFLFPHAFLKFFNWQVIDPFTSRLVAAALFGIGIESYLGRNASLESIKNILNLKVIWSAAAVIGIFVTIAQDFSNLLFIQLFILIVFLVFNIIWVNYRVVVARQLTDQ